MSVSNPMATSFASPHRKHRYRSRLKSGVRAIGQWFAVLYRNGKYLAATTWTARYKLPLWVTCVCWCRFVWYAVILKRTRIHQLDAPSDSAVAENTIPHNQKGLHLNALRAFSGERPDLLLRVISAIETVDAKSARVLFVGPRAESELILARGYGFRKPRIRGLDLISYSPWVDLGDMHRMPYADDAWDVIVLGWVLAYSERPEMACQEILRVAKPGAVIAIGAQYHPLSPIEIGQSLGYIPGAKTRLQSTEALLELFGGHVEHVYFAHDVHPRRRSQPGLVALTFSITK